MSERWIRRILALAPRRFRDRYGDELLETDAERRGEHGGRARRWAFAIREAAGLVGLIVRLRLGLDARADGGLFAIRRAGGSTVGQDVRFALRTLVRAPRFSLTAALVLALGIGATSAIFSAADAYFLRPLPFAEPERLVTVFETNPEFGWTDETAAPANLLDWRDQVRAFADVSGYTELTDQLPAMLGGEPVTVTGTEVVGNSPRVVLINDTLAREHFPGEDPVGQRIAFTRTAGPESTWYEIVGVVGDQHQESLAQPVRGEVFESVEQQPGRNHWLVVRGEGGETRLAAAAREVLEELDPLIPVAQVRSLADVRSASMAREELVLTLLGAFGALALLLASVGVYAVTSRVARARTREIGIRMALGARAAGVRRLVVRQGLALVAAGLAAGTLAAIDPASTLRLE